MNRYAYLIRNSRKWGIVTSLKRAMCVAKTAAFIDGEDSQIYRMPLRDYHESPGGWDCPTFCLLSEWLTTVHIPETDNPVSTAND